MGETSRSRGKKAWLVTWEWSGDHARQEEPVVAIYRPQLSGDRVRERVECLYAAKEYTPADMLRALDDNPYPAEFGAIDGVRWEGEVICGHNPWLRARLVDDLVIGDDGKPAWKERSRPAFPKGFIR